MWLVFSIISTVLAETLSNPAGEASSILNSQAGGVISNSKPICFSKCSINGRLNQACMGECQKKMGGEQSNTLTATKSAEVKQTNCGQICYQQCYVNNMMNQACYNQCMQQCQGVEKVEEQAPIELKQTNCGQICYQKCYVNNMMNQACYNQCIQQCQAEEKLEKPVQALELSAGSVNCGQICFQNCYVNFQMISGCYLNCLGTCTSTSTTLQVSDIDRNCEMNCYKESCATGIYNSENYAVCVTKRCERDSAENKKLPVPINNCQWECYTSGWADSFFYLEAYEKCVERICTQVELKKVSPLRLKIVNLTKENLVS